jgi:release factor glutamine methyltransferase
MHTTLQSILSQYQTVFDSLDVELLIAHVIDTSREFVLAHPEYEVTKGQYAKIEALMKRRLDHEPIAYILGHREFFGLDFKVTPDTLIPRPETELMVEEILKHESQSSPLKRKHCIVDVGTGSGCIIISLAHELLRNHSDVHYDFYGVDISSRAIAVAQDNARKHTLEKNITFIRSDLLETISQKIIDESFDSLIIAANLPYLSHTIYTSSIPDVKNFEPSSALISEEDGLRHYQRLLEQIQTIQTEKKSMSVKLFFEISPEQKSSIEKLIRDYFPQANIEIKKDFAQKYRLAITLL